MSHLRSLSSRPPEVRTPSDVARALATCKHPRDCRVDAEAKTPGVSGPSSPVVWCGACGAMHVAGEWVRPALAIYGAAVTEPASRRRVELDPARVRTLAVRGRGTHSVAVDSDGSPCEVLCGVPRLRDVHETPILAGHADRKPSCAQCAARDPRAFVEGSWRKLPGV